MLLLSAGKNDHSQLGNRGSSGKALPILNPVKENTQLYDFEDEIVSFSAGRSHNVIVLKNGTCYGWGCNILYDIGLPKPKDYPFPTLISFRSFLSKYFFKEPFIVEAVCGHSFTLYLDKAGAVYYAKGNTDECSLQKINFSKEEIISIHGYIQPCIIGKSGTIYMINDDYTAQPIPYKFTDKNDADDDSGKIIDVCTTKKSIICLTKNGRVYMLNTLSGTLFTIINSLLNEKIIKVLGKTNNFFALSESGKIFTYDNEAEGELFSPLEFPIGTKIIDFSIGYDFTCFIDSENSLWCSGSKSNYSLLGIKKNSINKPEKSTLIESQKYRAMQVHCGYSHLLILAKDKTDSESDQVQISQQIPLSEAPEQPKKQQQQQETKQQNSTSPSRFRFPFFSSSMFGQNDKPERNSTENSTNSTDVATTNNNNNDDESSDVSNSSEINLQNAEILNKIKQMTDQNKELMKEIEKLKNEKHENKKDQQISDLQNENKKLREENERLQSIIQSTITQKEEDKNDKEKDNTTTTKEKNKDDDYFGYKIDDVCNCYFSDKYLLKPTETIKLFDRKQFIQNFHIIKKSTSYNDYKGMSKTFKISLNNFYAMKVLNFTPDDLSNPHTMMNMLKLFLREYEIMLYNLHPCILKTYGFNFGDVTHPPTMLIEYCPLNLMETIKRLKKGKMVRIIVEIAYAMRFLHSNNFIHKNLTPENIMIDKNWNSKLSGFGYSNHLLDENEVDSSIEMIPDPKNFFLAPELIEGKKNIDNKVDVYSFGILTLFILTHGTFPSSSSPLFSEEEEGNEVIDVNDRIKIGIPGSVNENARSLIKVCCKVDPNERPDFDTILQFLKEKDYKIVNNYDPDHLKKRITEIELCEQS